MKKKLFIILIVLSVVYMVGTIFVEENLAKYTVYYAQRMPHAKDKHPVPFLILEELDFLEKSKGIGYSYDTYDSPVMYSNKGYLGRSSYALMYRASSGQTYSFDEINHKLMVTSTKEGTFTESNEKEFKSVNVDEVWKDIDSFLEPFIKRQPKPRINLQWLFNWRYEKRFD